MIKQKHNLLNMKDIFVYQLLCTSRCQTSAELVFDNIVSFQFQTIYLVKSEMEAQT
jgi:hypothetical protein